ncbi:MAG: tRNA threonylcarbamoyladenosine biosynthesis protein TsaB [Thermocrinis sp.]|nr:tRNA threonylcarbamoyladenosine biosynthesis protein TsaB [Thermocrinis sp.]
MRLLSIDTSFSFFNLSVVEDGRLSMLYYEDSKKKSLELLPTLLNKLGINPEDFDAFALSVGIGYTTPLRIGITFLKTIAFLTQKPLYTYENLELMLRYVPVPAPKTALLRVSSHIIYRVQNQEGIGPIKLWKGEPLEGTTIVLRNHSIDFADIQLDFFPFSAYGGLFSYERLKAGEPGVDLFSLEPCYI